MAPSSASTYVAFLPSATNHLQLVYHLVDSKIGFLPSLSLSRLLNKKFSSKHLLINCTSGISYKFKRQMLNSRVYLTCLHIARTEFEGI